MFHVNENVEARYFVVLSTVHHMNDLSRFTVINRRIGLLPAIGERISTRLHQITRDADAHIVLVSGSFINQILPGSPDPLLTPEKAQELRQSTISGSKIVLIVDLSTEGYKYDQVLLNGVRHLESIMRSAGFSECSIVIVQTNYALAGEYSAHHPGDRHVHFYHYHFYLDRFLQFCLNSRAVRGGIQNLNRRPGKLVLCLNHRPRYHRLYCILWAMERFGPRNVSATLGEWQLNYSIDAIKKIEQRRYPDLPPYDEVSRRLEAFSSDLRLVTDAKSSQLAISLQKELFQDTFCSLVTETEMETPVMHRYTEKMLKPFVMAHPFVAAANKGTVAEMTSLGFDVLSDEIDHAYDELDDPQDRLTSALQSAEALFAKDQREQMTFLERTRPRLEANVRQFDGRLLAKLTRQWETELQTIITKQMRDWLNGPG